MFRIKTITEPTGNRCNVTIEETDILGKPTGREFTEKFGTVDKDWAELKKRFEKAIADDDTKNAKITDLITEANNAGLTSIS